MTDEVIIFWDTFCCIAVVITFSDKKFEIVAAVCFRIFIEPFAAHCNSSELAQYRFALVFQCLVNHIGLLRSVVERHTSDAYFREKVVFTNFSPFSIVVVIPCSVESAEIKVSRNIAVGINAAALNCCIQSTIRNDINVAAHQHHNDTVGAVFLNDVITDLFLIVCTLC